MLPVELCETAVDILCDNLLPFILVPGEDQAQASNDYVPAMIQTVMYKASMSIVGGGAWVFKLNNMKDIISA